ncbi:MAG: TlpA family protein disulfide reductase [Sphingobacterium sp.]
MRILLLSILLASIVSTKSVSQTKANSPESLIVLDHPDSMSQLMKKFKGRVVYIDVLASWCRPCIEQFEHSAKLDDYFTKNKIVKLYVTIDHPDDIEDCVDVLKENGMTGYFTSYSSKTGGHTQFSDDIEEAFLTDENGDFHARIPRYGIVDKEGKIVINNAKRPSASKELKMQFEKLL